MLLRRAPASGNTIIAGGQNLAFLRMLGCFSEPKQCFSNQQPSLPASDSYMLVYKVYRSKLIHSRNYSVSAAFVKSDRNLFVGGSIHQGADRLSNVSRGRQCAFMSRSKGSLKRSLH